MQQCLQKHVHIEEQKLNVDVDTAPPERVSVGSLFTSLSQINYKFSNFKLVCRQDEMMEINSLKECLLIRLLFVCPLC